MTTPAGHTPRYVLPAEGLALIAEEGRVRLQLRAYPMGEEVCLLLDGGDRPHVGAVAVTATDEAVQIAQRPDHREAELVEALARIAGDRLGSPVAVVGGIHLDGITPQEIDTVLHLSHHLLQQLLDRMIIVDQKSSE